MTIIESALSADSEVPSRRISRGRQMMTTTVAAAHSRLARRSLIIKPKPPFSELPAWFSDHGKTVHPFFKILSSCPRIHWEPSCAATCSGLQKTAKPLAELCAPALRIPDKLITGRMTVWGAADTSAPVH